MEHTLMCLRLLGNTTQYFCNTITSQLLIKETRGDLNKNEIIRRGKREESQTQRHFLRQ